MIFPIDFDKIKSFDVWNRERVEMNETYILEKMSISHDVDVETDEVVKFLETQFRKPGNLTLIKKYVYGDEYIVNILPVFKVFDHDCEFCLNLINLKNNLSDDEKKELYRNHHFGLKTETTTKQNGDMVDMSFQISGDIILSNMNVGTFSSSIISHELMHIFMRIQIFDGLKYIDSSKFQKKRNKWRRIYRNCLDILNGCKNDDFRRYIGKDFYKIIYSLYTCDKGEIAAFTQQAYVECGDCRNKDEIQAKLEHSILYEMRRSFKTTLDILKKPEIDDEYDNKKKQLNIDLPDIRTLMKLIEKRYKKIDSNYGKLWTLLIEEFMDRNGVIYRDIHY